MTEKNKNENLHSEIESHSILLPETMPNTVYMLWAYALALWDITPFGRKVVYAENVR